ncbi:DUF4873 domain-containing protein [Mycolicibacterium psychrotolerans]|uniref:DUF4873 domain-containing protein n=1 Tax=Mycolicibacterium psychrotolerans TaxID=216929 RepID=A0A7I7M8Z9_9MYCO|nr:DUF4873 domain-containing protein [Mycolicibacterium psychrotolerans]BBX68506.1 hypothetical protein MPSYJ_19670 [Mycolicibacterium psychrotolerans]
MTETVMYVSGAVDAQFDEQVHTWTVGGRSARVLISTDGTLPASAPPSAGTLEPYLGVAVHGVPNYFLLTGPDTAAQKSYIAKCLQHLSRTDGSRIEVRAGTQRMFNDRRRRPGHRSGRYWRAVGAKIPSAFDVQSAIEDDAEIYDGPATVTVDGRDHAARVRLTGRMEPIDGRYHWRGTVFADLPAVLLPHEVHVAVGDRAARARLTERTPQAGYSVAGTGSPPFALAETHVDVPLL